MHHNFVQVDVMQAAICVLASQIANFGESLIGAALQEKDGYKWVSTQFDFPFNYDLYLSIAVSSFMLSMGNFVVNQVLLHQTVFNELACLICNANIMVLLECVNILCNISFYRRSM